MSASTPTDPLAPVLMTLAGIAYGQPSAIQDYLVNDTLTNGDWRTTWIAEQVADPVNFCFVAQSRKTGDYCTSIRGTYPNPFSWAYWQDASQDNPRGTMQSWPISAANADTGPKISAGTSKAFKNLIALSDGKTTLQQAVQAIPTGSTVFVTGHSLGGTLAPVIALWMTSLPNKLIPTVYCFAGMTPGNQDFANLFGPGTALNGRVKRFSNTLDSVPYGWDNVLATRDFYEPSPKGGLVVEAAIDALAFDLRHYGFTAIGEEVKLTGNLSNISIGVEFLNFVIQNLYQHLPDTYLSLLGAPSLPFTLGFGSVVVPKVHPTAAKSTSSLMPVYYV